MFRLVSDAKLKSLYKNCWTQTVFMHIEQVKFICSDGQCFFLIFKGMVGNYLSLIGNLRGLWTKPCSINQYIICENGPNMFTKGLEWEGLHILGDLPKAISLLSGCI